MLESSGGGGWGRLMSWQRRGKHCVFCVYVCVCYRQTGRLPCCHQQLIMLPTVCLEAWGQSRKHSRFLLKWDFFTTQRWHHCPKTEEEEENHAAGKLNPLHSCSSFSGRMWLIITLIVTCSAKHYDRESFCVSFKYTAKCSNIEKTTTKSSGYSIITGGKKQKKKTKPQAGNSNSKVTGSKIKFSNPQRWIYLL